jgi:predicted ATPase/DNA-binding winged helix-turn-helix (wHTH) protein
MNSTSTHSRAVQTIRFEFGPFSFDPIRRELRDTNGPIRIGSRSMVLLEVMLESPGRLCSREELVSRAWPRTLVEETSLRVHISALRRVLRDGQADARYITNAPGRGYAFVDEVRVITQDSTTRAEGLPQEPFQHRKGPPIHLTRTVGRGCAIARIGELISRERLVNIVGAGGIGKTTVALVVADTQQRLHDRDVFFVSLAKITDPADVVAEVAQACGLDASRDASLSMQALENALSNQQALLILDSCEHVIDAVADLVVRLVRSCPQLRLLATSREPLEVESEWVFRLPPLDLPEPHVLSEVEAMLGCPAIELFVERARASSDQFHLNIDNVAEVRQLCEFLDGIPLALELAAARVNSLGMSGILMRLEDAFGILTYGRRTAESRHRTLHAVLDWSYQLLTETERRVLHRLSVFRGGFDLDAAVTVAASADLPHESVLDAVLSLYQKSLVIRTSDEPGIPRYRLHHITRLFAEKQLAAETAAAEVSRRHTARMLRLMPRRDEGALDRPHAHRQLIRDSR